MRFFSSRVTGREAGLLFVFPRFGKAVFFAGRCRRAADALLFVFLCGLRAHARAKGKRDCRKGRPDRGRRNPRGATPRKPEKYRRFRRTSREDTVALPDNPERKIQAPVGQAGKIQANRTAPDTISPFSLRFRRKFPQGRWFPPGGADILQSRAF